MRRTVRLVAALIAGLGLLAALGYVGLMRTLRGWYHADLTVRSRLAVEAASGSLARSWTQKPARLRETLEDIARDDRIAAVAACSADGRMLASTAMYPAELSCPMLLDRLRSEGTEGPAPWWVTAEVPVGKLQVGVSPLRSGARDLGVVAVVPDLGDLAPREAAARNMILFAFLILAAASSIVTLLAARIAWRRWTADLRRALSGEPPREFLPLLRDVQDMAGRLAGEIEHEAGAGPWSPERLRSTLTRHLHGERVVVLANREPYIHEATHDGTRVVHPASGLVTALEPVMRACKGVWVAHGSGSADRATADEASHIRMPPGEESYVVRRVWLSEDEENGYYYGFSNEGLWPLCHVAHARPVFRASDWEHYVRVNERFAVAVCEEVDSDDPIVLVQDYHFALAPTMIRQRLPRATILSFWHVPWPSAERVGICPWREEIISGLLGSSIVGFHTQQYCNNFLESVDTYLESRIDREWNAVFQGARRTMVRPYPISIEWPVHWLDQLPSVAECRGAVRRELGLASDALLGVGVDRLDYTKGIEERLAAVNDLLERHPPYRGRFTFVQLAAPSRTKIPRYRELGERVASLAAEINARWSSGAYRPIVLCPSHHEPLDVYLHYRAADLCYVSSLHDGMNLVAKEFVAARDDERGVLVLSQFTGAARDLTEALIVNPYDIRQAADALAAALRMPGAEQRERMQSLRRMVSQFNVYRWTGRMLVDAAELRRRERTTGRLATPASARYAEAR